MPDTTRISTPPCIDAPKGRASHTSAGLYLMTNRRGLWLGRPRSRAHLPCHWVRSLGSDGPEMGLARCILRSRPRCAENTARMRSPHPSRARPLSRTVEPILPAPWLPDGYSRDSAGPSPMACRPRGPCPTAVRIGRAPLRLAHQNPTLDYMRFGSALRACSAGGSPSVQFLDIPIYEGARPSPWPAIRGLAWPLARPETAGPPEADCRDAIDKVRLF